VLAAGDQIVVGVKNGRNAQNGALGCKVEFGVLEEASANRR
jgi:hypothetical protein